MNVSSQSYWLVSLVALSACAAQGAPVAPEDGAPVAGDGGGASGASGSAGAAGAGGTLGGSGVGGTGVMQIGGNGAAGAAGASTAGIGGSSGTGGRAGAGGSSGSGGMGAAGMDMMEPTPGGPWWKPVAGLSWQWQIGGGTIDPNLEVDVFDIDWEESADTVEMLHAAGKKVVCYVSVGSWEEWRPDADDFPAAVLGNDYPDWPGEKFVDIRAQALRDVMASRFDTCKAKGFDAVEPDNMDVFSSDSGFDLTSADGVDYAEWMATACHDRGLAIVQKNAPEITEDIAAVYDGALTEDCYADGNWCADMQPYIDADKPVFACEYDAGIFDDACSWGTSRNYSFILKNLDLDAPITFCP